MFHVLVLHARLGAGPGPHRLGLLLECLPYAKRLELEGREPREMHASLAGIAMVLQGLAVLSGSPVDIGQLRFPAGGRPYMPLGPSFSVSHGGTRVAAALGVGAVVGFDLEEFHPGARESAAGRARLARWTATEAVLKAAGLGLREATAVDLGETLRHGRIGGASFHLAPVGIAQDVVAYLASDAPVSSISVEDVGASAPAFRGQGRACLGVQRL